MQLPHALCWRLAFLLGHSLFRVAAGVHLRGPRATVALTAGYCTSSQAQSCGEDWWFEYLRRPPEAGRLLTVPDALQEPLRWRRSRMVFVNSMSDLFHEHVPAEFVRRVFGVMQAANWHTFQVLTKRPERCLELADGLPWPGNMWMGTSVESNDYVRRVNVLRKVPAAVRFLSLDPLLGPLPDIVLSDIHWVIVGGESGPGARLMKPEWVRDIHRACRDARVPFFFKQWGGIRKKAAGRMLDGKTWDEMPIVRPVAAE
jgi:protein gp37